MAVRNLWLLGVGLAACLMLCGDGYPQQPIPAPGLPTAVPESVPPVQSPVIPPVAPAASVPASTVDQLIDQLTELRRQKAELERREELVIKLLRDKLKAQAERLEKLGIAPGPKETPPVPDVKAEVPALPTVDASKAPR